MSEIFFKTGLRLIIFIPVNDPVSLNIFNILQEIINL